METERLRLVTDSMAEELSRSHQPIVYETDGEWCGDTEKPLLALSGPDVRTKSPSFFVRVTAVVVGATVVGIVAVLAVGIGRCRGTFGAPEEVGVAHQTGSGLADLPVPLGLLRPDVIAKSSQLTFPFGDAS